MSDFEEPSSNPTHTVWAPYFFRGEFKEWIKAGQGYEVVGADGTKGFEVYTYCLPIDFNGELLLTPVGQEPTDPPLHPPDPPQELW